MQALHAFTKRMMATSTSSHEDHINEQNTNSYAYVITLSEDGEYLLAAGVPAPSGYGLQISRFTSSDGQFVDEIQLGDYVIDYLSTAFHPAGKNRVFLIAVHGAYLLDFSDKLMEYTCFLYEEGNGFGGLDFNYLCYKQDEKRFYIRGEGSWDSDSPVKRVDILNRDGLIKAGKDYLKKHGQ